MINGLYGRWHKHRSFRTGYWQQHFTALCHKYPFCSHRAFEVSRLVKPCVETVYLKHRHTKKKHYFRGHHLYIKDLLVFVHYGLRLWPLSSLTLHVVLPRAGWHILMVVLRTKWTWSLLFRERVIAYRYPQCRSRNKSMFHPVSYQAFHMMFIFRFHYKRLLAKLCSSIACASVSWY